MRGRQHDHRYQDQYDRHDAPEYHDGYYEPSHDGYCEPGHDGYYEPVYDGDYQPDYRSGHCYDDAPIGTPPAGRGVRRALWFVTGLTLGLIGGAGGVQYAGQHLAAAVEDAVHATGPGDGQTSAAPGDGDGDGTGSADGAQDPGGADSADGTDETGPRTAAAGPRPDPSEPESAPDPSTDGSASIGADSELLGCTVDDTGTPVIEVINRSSVLSDYLLMIDLVSSNSGEVTTQAGEIYALRPGERTVETVIVDQPGGDSCQVSSLVAQPVEVTVQAAADVSGCEVLGADEFNEVTATVTIFNSDSVASSYFIDVAIVDASGLRHGTGYVDLAGVAAGQTIAAELESIVHHQSGLQCQVVAVLRTPS